MSNNGEDIIRETFKKLGGAIGVQMQMPDAMIANLGAVLQAQIDLLAELQSTGRLLADDETRLTAEQVEDVRTVLKWIDDGAPRGGLRNSTVNRIHRALSPATEPAEDAKPCGANSVTFGWCKLTARHEGLHTNGTYLWGNPSEPDPPAPSGPAEEETKAEALTTFLEGVLDYDSADMGWHLPGDWDPTGLADAIVHALTSSPVVPAPTETGPWHAVAEIPKGVACIRDREGDVWRRCGSGWELGALHDPIDYSPFVAVKEEEA